MFQFTTFALPSLISFRQTRLISQNLFDSYTFIANLRSQWKLIRDGSDHFTGRVAPFGYLRINVCLPTPRSFSQATTSFFAFNRLGIHHMHLVTWLYYFSQLTISCFVTRCCFESHVLLIHFTSKRLDLLCTFYLSASTSMNIYICAF